MIVIKVNLDNIESKRLLTIEDAKEILSLLLVGIGCESHDLIEVNNCGVPIF